MTDLDMTKGLRTYLSGGAFALDLERLYQIRKVTSKAIEQKEREHLTFLCKKHLADNDYVWYRTSNQRLAHILVNTRIIGASIEGNQLCRKSLSRRISGHTLKYSNWHFGGEQCKRCEELKDQFSGTSTQQASASS